MSVSNSTFVGNVAENHGGAIYSEGGGAVELTNCSFVGNEAVGMGDYRRAGSGGAIYTSPGVFVTVRVCVGVWLLSGIVNRYFASICLLICSAGCMNLVL